MAQSRDKAPNEWFFVAGMLCLLAGSLSVALLHGPWQLLALPLFAISAACAFCYAKSVIRWKPTPSRR
ncbi:hypothetical protein [Kocuria rhizophila]|uniref:hypothetical protein n=1 Tax=Kocuria rhizophila TaxID=72000 RepID=UPI000EACDC61|nr:hypothetical protein [Kocuria rhizophila]